MSADLNLRMPRALSSRILASSTIVLQIGDQPVASAAGFRSGCQRRRPHRGLAVGQLRARFVGFGLASAAPAAAFGGVAAARFAWASADSVVQLLRVAINAA